MKKIWIVWFLVLSCCTIDFNPTESRTYDLKITAVLTENGIDTLLLDSNNHYHLKLNRDNHQTVRRITGYITSNMGEPYPPEKVVWESNLFWWIKRGDLVAQITKTYFNPFTGVLQPVILPPLLSQKDELVPTINCCSYSGKNGQISTMIAPIKDMVGDTLIVQAYNYTSNKYSSVKIVLE